MIADTSDLHVLSAAQLRYADALSSVAADLTACTVTADAFGSVGASFLSALNQALAREAARAMQLAERLGAATVTARATADAYRSTDDVVGQAVSLIRV